MGQSFSISGYGRMDYYKALEVKTHATDKEIKASYRKLAKQHHPDAAGDDPAKTRKMYEIQEAYDVLSDPGKRAEYDAGRRTGTTGAAYGGAGRSRRNGHGLNAGQPGGPVPDMSRFEQFFGFQPGKGMGAGRAKETGSDEDPGQGRPEGPVKPEEMFASFFGKIKR